MLRSIALLATLLTPGLAPAQDPPALDDAALRPLADGLAAYVEARTTSVGIDAARAELLESLAVLREGLGGADPLSGPADLGRALWLSRGYDRQKVRAGKVVTERFLRESFAGGGMELTWRLPKDYDPGARSYPLVVAIPGEAEEPAEHVRTHWNLRAIQDGAIVVCPAMPTDREEWDQVMVNGRPGGLCHVLTALRVALERFAVDPDRVFVTGRGKGVPAAVAAGNYAPQRFAGVIGRGGDAGELAPSNFANLPTLFCGGGAQATAFAKGAEAVDAASCTLLPLGKEEDVWSWMEAHPRVASPDEVRLTVGTPFPTRVGWLRVSPIASDAHARAVIEREANTIRVDGEGVSHATLYLNDALVDLDRPLTVVCNGLERELSVPRRLSSALELLFEGTSDAGCVYVAEARFDMRGEGGAAPVATSAPDAELDERFAAAGDEVAALWALHEWCLATQREAGARRALLALVRIAPEHEEARAALGHVRSDAQWFSSQQAFERFQQRQDPERAAALGLVENKGLWMHPDERARANKGLVKDQETGQWLSVADRRRLDEGWARQDLEWIEPEEAHFADEGLWRVDGEWCDLEEANRRRARIDSMWRIPSAEILMYATVDRDVALRAMEAMRRALDDLRLVFGVEPALPLPVVVLRDEEQYDRFAFGDPDGRRPPSHVGRLHVIHSAVFAESWFPLVGGEREARGAGVCYWDALVPYGDLYGVHSARLAIGLSYVDALDPSPKAVRKALAKGPGPEHYPAYQAEKELPDWLRYGGAVYAERFFRDATVATDGDPWWARNWSLENIAQRGGLRPLDEVLAFDLDPDERDDSQKLLIEAGLLVAFLVDGGCEPVSAAHAEFQRVLRAGRLRPSHLAALTEALVEHEAELRKFAGL